MECQLGEFDIDKGETYLAACGRYPLPKKAAEAGEKEVAKKLRRPWEVSSGAHGKRVREQFAKLVGADVRQVFTLGSTSSAAALLARLALPDAIERAAGEGGGGRRVVVVVAQDTMDSLLLSLQLPGVVSLVRVPVDKLYAQRMLDAIRQNPGCIALLEPCHWTTGWMLDMEATLQLCADLECICLIDATQSAGVLDFNVAAMPPNLRFILCASVHKHLMGVHGCCLCCMSSVWLTEWDQKNVVDVPFLERHARQFHVDDWDTRAGAMGENGYPLVPLDGAARWSAGLSNPVGWAILSASLELVLSWSRWEQVDYLKQLSSAAKVKLDGYEELQIRGDSPHIFSISLPSFELTEKLQLHLSKLRVHTDLRHGGVRIGLGMYNTMDDIERLVNAVVEFLK